MVLTSVKNRVMWRVVVTTVAEKPPPSVKVATVASTLVLTITSSPVEIVLVASVQSDQVASMLGVEVAMAWKGGPPFDTVGFVSAATGELSLELIIDSQSPQVSVPGIDEEVVSASTTLLGLVVEEILISWETGGDAVVISLTGDSLLVVVDIQSAQVSLSCFEDDEVVIALTTALVVVVVVVVVVVELLFISVVDDFVFMSAPTSAELAATFLAGISLVLIGDVQSDHIIESVFVGAGPELLDVTTASTTGLLIVGV